MATYYADNTVADASTYDPATRTNGGGSAVVRNTIQEAINLATSPGDIVEIRAGTYAAMAWSAAAGTSGNPITIRAYQGETVLCQRFRAQTGHHWQHVTGLTFTLPGGGSGGNSAGVRLYSDNNYIEDCILLGGPTQAYGVAITGANNTIHGLVCDLTNSAFIYTHDGPDNSAVMIDSTQSFGINALAGGGIYNWTDIGGPTGASNGTIVSNTATSVTATLANGGENLWDTGDKGVCGKFIWIGFYIDGPGTIIEDCVLTGWADPERVFSLANAYDSIIRRNTINGIRASHDASGPHCDIIQTLDGETNLCTNVLWENNRFLNCDSQGSNLEMDAPYMQNWIVRGNVWHTLNAQWGPKVLGTKYYNNTCYNIGGTYPFGYWDDDDTEVYNNVFIGEDSNSDALNVTAAAGAADVKNNYYAYLPSFTAFPGDMNADYGDNAAINGGDPMFVDAVGLDLRLLIGSPLIGAGRDLSAEWPGATDLYGTARGSGGSWDIGAYEFTSGGDAPEITLTAPADGATFISTDSINFTGTATDTEDGDISADIEWTSDIDGALGTGASINHTLTVGSHTITATITDDDDNEALDTITLTILPAAQMKTRAVPRGFSPFRR